jgi:hypothetical protein
MTAAAVNTWPWATVCTSAGTRPHGKTAGAGGSTTQHRHHHHQGPTHSVCPPPPRSRTRASSGGTLPASHGPQAAQPAHSWPHHCAVQESVRQRLQAAAHPPAPHPHHRSGLSSTRRLTHSANLAPSHSRRTAPERTMQQQPAKMPSDFIPLRRALLNRARNNTHLLLNNACHHRSRASKRPDPKQSRARDRAAAYRQQRTRGQQFHIQQQLPSSSRLDQEMRN